MGDRPRYRGGTLRVPARREQIAYKGKNGEGAWLRTQAGTQEKRRRIGRERLAERAKMIGTKGRGRKGSGRVEAYIGDDRDRRGFPNNAASERGDRVSRGELVQEARHIEARERRENTRRINGLRVQSFELFHLILVRFWRFHLILIIYIYISF